MPFSNNINDWIQEVHASCRRPKYLKLFHFDDDNNDLKIPNVVYTDPMVQWSFNMIRNTIKRLNIVSKSRRFGLDCPTETYLQTFSNMPLLLKTCLLINDNSWRRRIFDYPFMKRCLLMRHVVDKWLVVFLADDKLASRAIEYFEVLSRLTPSSGLGIVKPSATDVTEFKQKMDDVILHLSKIDYILPALFMLKNQDMKRASETYPVQRILELSMTNTSLIAIIVFDLCMHILLIMSYGRQEGIFIESFDVSDVTTISSAPIVMSSLTCIYLFLRENLTYLILLQSLRKIIIGELIGIISIIGVLGTNILYLISHSKISTVLYAITKLLVYFRFLLFLKGINLHLTMFIVSLGKILSSMRWFLVVMMLNLFLFADMMHFVVVAQVPDECQKAKEENTNDVIADLCSSNMLRNVLRTYSIIVGDVYLDDYRFAFVMTLVWCAFVAVGVIMLLNVLIAIVSKSYAESDVQRHSLLGKARIPILAKHSYLNSRVKAISARGYTDIRYWLLLIAIVSFLLIFGIAYILFMGAILSVVSYRPKIAVFFYALTVSMIFLVATLSMAVVVRDLFNIHFSRTHRLSERFIKNCIAPFAFALLGIDQNENDDLIKFDEKSKNDEIISSMKEMIDSSTAKIRNC